MSAEMPQADEAAGETQLCYVARFGDVDAARMHVHEQLHHHLVDVDSGLYRCSLIEAMAAIESDALRHERVWIDHSLSEQTVERMELATEQLRRREMRIAHLWRLVGTAALIWLGLKFLGLF